MSGSELSPRSELQPFHAPQGLHLVLAVGLPWLATALLTWEAFSPWPWGLCVLALAHGLALGFWAPWSLFSRQNPLVKFWLWLGLQVLTGAFLFLFGGEFWWGWGLLLFVQGQLTVILQNQLTPRARLYFKLEGIADGPALEARVHDFQLDADFSAGNRHELLGHLAALGVVVVAVSSSLPRGMTSLGTLLAAGFVVLLLVVAAMTGGWRREMGALVYGRRFTWAEKARSLALAVGLLAVCALGAWLLVSTVGTLVDWRKLLSGAPHIPVPEAPQYPIQPVLPPEASEGPSFSALVIAFWYRVLHVDRLVLLVGVGLQVLAVALPLGLLLWALWPLFRLLGPDRPRTPGLLRLWWKLLLLQWKEFWHRLWVLPGELAPSADRELLPLQGVDAWLASLVRSQKGKRLPLYPELLAAFVRLLEWARPEVEYQLGETTTAWARRVAAVFPLQAAEVLRVSELLEVELFSSRRLDAGGRREFLAAVNSVVVSSKV
ncbi:MAG: DUF4129 domain-containing protein [Spirochaetales bacterium]